MAYAYKEQGNEYFKAGHFKEAEEMYSQAIHHRSNDSILFNNRALARLRMKEWKGAEDDSRRAIELQQEAERDSHTSTSSGTANTSNATANTPAMIKSRYNLAQALIYSPRPNLERLSEALDFAQQAYQLCLATSDRSTETLSQFTLQAKQARWRAKETIRLHESSATLARLETLLDREFTRDVAEVESRFAAGEVGETGREEDIRELEQDLETRKRITRDSFAAAEAESVVGDGGGARERIVPDWIVDPITFEVMHDPVTTPSGGTYERVSLLKHLKQAGVDPLSREKMSEKQIQRNYALQNACEWFLETNGWAVDY